MQQDPVVPYKSLMASIGIYDGPDGKLSFIRDGVEFPVLCEGKRLVLPTRDVLRTANWNECIAFHPLCESIIRKESVVVAKLRQLINYRITEVICEVATEILAVACDHTRHSTLSPKQAEMLSLIPDVDAKTCDSWNELVEVILQKADKRIVNIYLKAGGHVDNTAFRRAAIVTFPILEEFETTTLDVCGVKMRKRDKQAIGAMIKWILTPTGSATIPNYSYGSNDDTAPYFHALVHAFGGIAKRLNAVSYLWRKVLGDNYKLIHTDLDWIEAFTDLTVYVGAIPTLAGNAGESDDPVALAPSVATPSTLPPPYGQHAPAAPMVPQSNAPAWPTIGKPMGDSAPGEPMSSRTADTVADDWSKVVMVKEYGQYRMPVFSAVGQPAAAPQPYGQSYRQPQPQYPAASYNPNGAPATGGYPPPYGNPGRLPNI